MPESSLQDGSCAPSINSSTHNNSPKNHPDTGELYSSRDIIGQLLSNWRTREVTKRITPGCALIDLACGDNRLVKRLGFGTGIDIKNYGNADLVLNDFTRLPFEAVSIDRVTILAALNYFDEPVEVLREIRRVLKPSGRLLVTLLWKPFSVAWHQLRDRGLPRYAYSAKELELLVSKADLEILETKRFMAGLNCLYIIGRK